MLESFAAAFLNKFLGSYVENFDPKQLKVGIWNGDVKLNNLKLRKEALDELDLPVNVKSGILGELTMQLPWSNLKNKPVKIFINNVFLLCEPRSWDSYDPEEDAERQFNLKMNDLDKLEAASSVTPVSDESNKNNANESFTTSLVNKIVDNVQVSIKNIHFRYEDFNSVFSEKPCSIGFSLYEMSAVSTNDEWTPSFISITQQISKKLLSLNSLSFYFNTNDTESVFDEDLDVLIGKFQESIQTEDENERNIYVSQNLVSPVTGSCKLSINKAGSTEEQPHLDALLDFSSFSLELDDEQYQELLGIASKFQWFQKSWKFRKFRPLCSVEEDPRAWFKYTATCVLNEVHEKNYKQSWEYIKERSQQKKEYVKLWKLKLASGDINVPLADPTEESELQELHKKLPLEAIRFFRALARKEYSKEQLELSHTLSSATLSTSESTNQSNKKNAQNSNTKGGGWFSSWWSAPTAEQSEEQSELIITEEQKKEFYDAIDWDENKSISEAVDIPEDRITLRIKNFLGKGSLKLKSKSNNAVLGEMVFEDCQTDIFQKPKSFGVSFKLFQFTVEDGSPNTLNKHIVKVNNGNSAEKTPFFEVDFEQDPPHSEADSSLSLKLKSMSVYYHVHFLNTIIQFFKPPKKHYDTLSALLSVAESTFEGWTYQTRMGLEALLEEHKNVDITCDLQTPLIIIPLDAHAWNTPCAIIDAGHISVNTELIPKSRIAELKKMSVDDYSKLETSDLNRLMFDRFLLTFDNAQFLIGPDIRSTISSLGYDGNTNQYAVLQKTHLEMMVDVSIFPKALNFPKIKTAASLPFLKLSLNDYQYKIIMQLLEVCLPNGNFQDLEDSQTQVSTNENEIQVALQDTVKRLANMSEAELKQRLFEFSLNVNSIEIKLHQCTAKEDMSSDPVVNLSGYGFELNVSQYPKDMKVLLSLTELHLLDQGDGGERSLLSSRKGDKSLFKLDLERSQRIVPFKNTLIEVFDQNIDLEMSSLKLNLNSNSILSILNYVLTTFTDINAPEMPADALRHNDDSEDVAPQKMNVVLKMDEIVVVFEDETGKLATLNLSNGSVDCYLLPEKMKVVGKLGNLELKDNLHEDLNLYVRQLISMQGGEVADFTYETFDQMVNNEIFTSKFKFNANSLKINFVEQTFGRLFEYMNNFQKMKGIYDAAREAAYNQTPTLDSINNIKLDVLVKTPIIEFPTVVDPVNGVIDNVTFYLGEFFMSNQFTKTPEKGTTNAIKTGLRSIKATSLFHLDNGDQNLELVEDLDMTMSIDCNEQSLLKTPAFKIDGQLSEMKLSLTDMQAKYLLSLQSKIVNSFVSQNPSQDFEQVQTDAIKANAVIAPHKQHLADEKTFSEQSSSEIVKQPEALHLDMAFTAPSFLLSFYDNTSKSTEIAECSISEISLLDTGVDFKMRNDGSFDGSAFFSTFTIKDTRVNKTSKHAYLVPAASSKEHQFETTVRRIVTDNNTELDVAVKLDNMRVILAIDFLISLKLFYDSCISAEPLNEVVKSENFMDESSLVSHKKVTETTFSEEQNATNLNLSVDIINPTVILLAYPESSTSEAIVFKIEKIMFTQKDIQHVSLSNIGMFMCNIDRFDKEHVRMIDDFSVSAILDDRDSSAQKSLTQIRLDVEKLVMRVALRDVRLAMKILENTNKMLSASGLLGSAVVQAIQDNNEIKFSQEFKLALAKYAPSLLSSFSLQTKDSFLNDLVTEKHKIEICAQNFTSGFGGLRLVLIGDVSELPLLDFNVNPFTIEAKNWSQEISVLGQLTSYTNVFNYSKSDWEPLIEPVPVTFKLAKGNKTDDASYNIAVYSKEMSEITISAESIQLLSKIPKSLSQYKENFSRGDIKPFKIVNETGADLKIWIDQALDDKRNETVVKNSESLPWEFEDWRKVRENLDTDNSAATLGFRVLDSRYTNTFKVNTKSELEELYKLEPPLDGVHHRIACHIYLDADGIKIIKFESPLIVTNQSGSKFELKINNEESVFIAPKSSFSIPFNIVYEAKYSIRPCLSGDEYEFSKKSFNWETLLGGPIFEKCSSVQNGSSFYYQIDAKYEEKEKLAKVFPHMEVVVSAPLKIENVLPIDVEIELLSKNTKEKIVLNLHKSESLPVHHINLNDFVFMKLNAPSTEYVPADYVLVASPNSSSLAVEKQIKMLKKNRTSILKLELKYSVDRYTQTKMMKIYSPYIILNRTERDIFIKAKGSNNIFTSKVSLQDGEYVTKPEMFSFDYKDDSNSAQIKMKDSDWSPANTLDALEQNFDMALSIPSKTMQTELGLHISEGLGKYSLSKLVTVSPRFIIKNEYSEDLMLGETRSIAEVVLEMNTAIPLYKMSTSSSKLCKLKFYGGNYSEPFPIGEIGTLYTKVFNKQLTKHILLKIETVLDNATLFLTVKDSNKEWPYSIRNFTEETYFVYQRDPNMLDSDRSYYTDANDDISEYDSYMYLRKPNEAKANYYLTGGKKFEPIRYKISPYTLMPFSWDFPAAKEKKIIVECRGIKRTVDLREIGNLKPFLVKKTTPDNEDAYVELNILADGPVQALVLSKYNPDVSLYTLRSKAKNSSSDTVSRSSSQSPVESFEVSNHVDGNNNGKQVNKFKVQVNFEGLGLSVINQKLEELMYITAKGLELRYNDSKMYQSISWKLKWLQIDNQLFGSMFPSVLYPTVINNVQEELDNHPCFSGSITKVNDKTRGLVYYKYATTLLQEMTIKLEEEFLVELLQFIKFSQKGVSQDLASDHTTVEEHGESGVESVKISSEQIFDNYNHSDSLLRLPESSIKVENADIYFETLHVQPTILHLSFMRSDGLQIDGEHGLLSGKTNDNDMEVYEAEDGDDVARQSGPSTLVNILTMTFGNVNDAPIQLNSVFLENLKVSAPMLIGLIREHYNNEFFRQVLKIAGYADVLGNPIGLFNNISSGVSDIFYKPYQGYFMNDRPEELGISIAQGGVSFLKKSVFGLSDSFSKFTGSVAKGLAAATQDKEFQRARLLQQRKNRINQDGSGVASGFSSLMNGISSGITGVASNSYEGAKKEGAHGFFKGLGRGLVGVPTKTVIGFLDMANNVSEEIRNNTALQDGHGGKIVPVRYPRFINHGSGRANGVILGKDDGLIKPFNLREAQGQYWLKMCNGGQFIKDHYIAHVVLPGKERILCVSQERVCEIDITTLTCISSVTIEEMCLAGTPIDDGRQIIVRILNRYTRETVTWKFPVPRAESRKYIIDHIILAQNRALRYMDDRL
ncbi:hypothetical protein ACO0QE_003138 [Hanseniaspora vineae]